MAKVLLEAKMNVIEGKVVIPPVELGKTAIFLGVAESELIHYKCGSLVSDLQYMGLRGVA